MEVSPAQLLQLGWCMYRHRLSIVLLLSVSACASEGVELNFAAQSELGTTRSFVNVRNAPGGSMAASLNAGERVEIVATENDSVAYTCFAGGTCDTWYQIISPKQGWVAADYVQLTEALPCDDGICTSLEETLEELDRRCGGTCGLAVQNLDTKERVVIGGKRRFVAASSMKYLWVAAALDAGVSPASIEVDAKAVFRVSDNEAAARVLTALDRSPAAKAAGLSGADYLNFYLSETVGLNIDPDEGTHFCRWRIPGDEHIASDCDPVAETNMLTAEDAMRFLEYINSPAYAHHDQLKAWASIDSIWDGLLEGLLLRFGSVVEHKVGFLQGTAWHDLGVIDEAGGPHYALVILTPGFLLPSISCVIHKELAGSATPFTACGLPQ